MSRPTEQNVSQESIASSQKKYIFSYLSAIVLTAISFWIVMSDLFSTGVTQVLLFILATIQILIQLFYFMHFKGEKASSNKAIALYLGILFSFIIIIGTIFIFYNTHYMMR